MSMISVSTSRHENFASMSLMLVADGPRPEEDEEGVRTVVEYYTNEQGKKVKVCIPRYRRERRLKDRQITRKIKRTLQKQVVDHTVAERKTWTKFGQEKGNKPGPDRATTTVGESVMLKLSAGNKVRHIYCLLTPCDRAHAFYSNPRLSLPLNSR